METALFEKLGLLKSVIGQMSISDKVKFAGEVASKLTPERLKFEDESHEFCEENLLVVGLVSRVTTDRNEFEAICGMYEGGYKSDLRKGIYQGCDVPLKVWRKEIRRLWHNVKGNCEGLQLPIVKGGTREPGESSWRETKDV
jgi:hypothetical protein